MDLFDVEVTERIESELDRIVEKRAREARDQERTEELWRESARCDLERRRAENRDAWRCFYLAQAERLERTAAELAADHRAKAADLAGEGASS